jgi:DNA-binding SARP family transcriptional activator
VTEVRSGGPDGGLRLQVMGPLRVWRADTELNPGPHQQRLLLAVLLAEHHRPVGMAEVVDLLWEADPPATAVNAAPRC